MLGTLWGKILDDESCEEFIESMLEVMEGAFTTGTIELISCEPGNMRSVRRALSFTRGVSRAGAEIEVTPLFTENNETRLALHVDAFVAGKLQHDIMVLIADAVTGLRERYSGTLEIELHVACSARLDLR